MDAAYSLYTVIATPLFNSATFWLLCRRRKPAPLTLALLLASAVLTIAISFTSIYDTYKSIYWLLTLPYLLVVLYCFEGRIVQLLFMVMSVLDYGAIAVFAFSPAAEAIAGYGTSDYYAWMMLFMTIIYALQVLVAALFLRGFFSRLFAFGVRGWPLFAIGAVLSRLVLGALDPGVQAHSIANPPTLAASTPFNYYMIICTAIWCFASTCVAVSFTMSRARVQLDLELSRTALAASRSHYEQLASSLDAARILRHDIKYKLNTAVQLARRGDNKGVLELLAAEQDSLAAPRGFCEHSIVDALLSWYDQRLSGKQVRFEAAVVIPSGIPVGSDDLCVLLGNMLENAYEACLGVEPDGRWARIRVRTEDSMLSLMVENSFDGEVREQAGQLLSRKPQGGSGLRSVQAVCERYNGEFLHKVEGGTFTAMALLNW